MAEATAIDRHAAIRVLNDNFRCTFIGGRVLLTAGVADLPLDVKARLLLKVKEFNQFTRENDPHGEHDFGSIELEGEMFFFKIDYYALGRDHEGSEDSADPSKTDRVLTIMHASEY
jgi:hypothetical protein